MAVQDLRVMLTSSSTCWNGCIHKLSSNTRWCQWGNWCASVEWTTCFQSLCCGITCGTLLLSDSPCFVSFNTHIKVPRKGLTKEASHGNDFTLDIYSISVGLILCMTLLHHWRWNEILSLSHMCRDMFASVIFCVGSTPSLLGSHVGYISEGSSTRL